ncbi:GNPTAG [Mytilus edulis]|uniref:GNPTG n=1 Tax=Mytilus edulis TaxID=6550 RepID=A0A8S3RV77_MYTED|nr:GNPTAG [Mytilus edulis]
MKIDKGEIIHQQFVKMCKKIIFYLLFHAYFTVLKGIEMVNMKIVEEPSSYGMNNFNNQQTQQEDNQLKMRVPPSKFSGPQHLTRLVNKCFSKQIDSYTYKLCPFSNVSQHEDSYRWNPYNGILGVWQEWEIHNNTFVAMVMREGDNCGNLFRSMKVFLRCGNKNEIVNVSEPSTCQYHMNFNTPYACHPHAMLVFPTLSEELRNEWELIEGRLVNEEITIQGYKKRLHALFEKAGYYLSGTAKDKLSKEAVKKEEKKEKEENGEFDTLYQCTQEYQKIKQQLDALKMVLKDPMVDSKTKDSVNKMEENDKQNKNSKGSSKRKKFISKLTNLMSKKDNTHGES